MPSLSFAALLSKEQDMDTEMKDAPPVSTEPLFVEIPLTFDFDFDFEIDELNSRLKFDIQSERDTHEPRSPRTPTYTGNPSLDNDSTSPFDPDKYFTFPILTSPQRKSQMSALQTIYQSPAAQSHTDLSLSNIETKENQDPVTLPLLPPLPNDPLLWIWTCHLCRSRYPLGATRRCLVDGHFYCSGDSGGGAQRNIKRKKKGQACSSEFDYVGWQDWADWKRNVIETKRKALAGSEGAGLLGKSLSLRGCESCEYPSQCRYEKINKIPQVVVAASRNKTDKGSDKRSKNAEQPSRKTSTIKKENGELKIETAVAGGQRGKGKNAESEESNLPVSTRDSSFSFGDEDRSNTVLTKTEMLKSEPPSPASPDLVDFSSMIVDPNMSSDQTMEEDTAEAGAVSDTINKSGSTGEPIQTRSRSRRRSIAGHSSSVKQSRINDFFSIMK